MLATVESSMPETFTDAERAAVYKAIMLRRDIRRQFESKPIPQEVLIRILSAAHHAGSVGFMQPWDFSIIDPVELAKTLALPEHVVPVAYLCVGYVSAFPDSPELERVSWRQRLPLSDLIHIDFWGNRPGSAELSGFVQ